MYDSHKNNYVTTVARINQASYFVFLGFFLLASCSGIKTYPNNLEQNVFISTTTNSGSVFTSINATVDIYRVKPDCTLVYQGTVQLDKPSVTVGLPADKFSYLVFGFASSSFLASSNSSISSETLLKPRRGYQYQIDVSYIDNIYNVELRESSPRKSAWRAIDTVALRTCQ